MADDRASFGMDIDSSGPERASASLDRMTASAKTATTSSVDLENQSTRLSQQLATMIRLEEDQTRLLQTIAAGHKEAAQAADQHSSTLLHLAAAVTGVSAAYYLLHEHTQRAAASMAAARDQMTATIMTVGQLNAALTANALHPSAADQAQRSHFASNVFTGIGFGAMMGWQPFRSMMAPIDETVGSAAWPMMRGAYTTARYAGRFGYQGLRAAGSLAMEYPGPLLAAGMAGDALYRSTIPYSGIGGNQGQLLDSLHTFGMRSNLSSGQIGAAAGWGEASGLGGGTTVAMVQAMQQSLHGLTQSAIETQVALHNIGVATKDPIEAVKQTLTALSRFTPGARRNLYLESVLPGSSPEMLDEASMSRAYPGPGTLGELHQRIAKEVGESQGRAADQQARLRNNEAQEQDRINLGLGFYTPSIAHITKNFEELMGSSAVNAAAKNEYKVNYETLMAAGGRKEGVGGGYLGAMTTGAFWQNIGMAAKSELAGSIPFLGKLEPTAEEKEALQKRVNEQAKLTLATPRTDHEQGQYARQDGALPRSPQETASIIRIFEELGVRNAPELLEAKMQLARTDLRTAQEGGWIDQATNDRLLAGEQARINRLADPIGYTLSQMGEEAQMAGMNPAEAQRQKTVFELNRQSIESYNTPLTAPQREQGAGIVAQGQVAAAGLNLQEQGRAVKEMHDLADAVHQGAGAMNLIKAAAEAFEWQLKTGATDSQTANEKTLLLAQSFESLRQQSEELAKGYRLNLEDSQAVLAATLRGGQRAGAAAAAGRRVERQFLPAEEAEATAPGAGGVATASGGASGILATIKNVLGTISGALAGTPTAGGGDARIEHTLDVIKQQESGGQDVPGAPGMKGGGRYGQIGTSWQKYSGGVGGEQALGHTDQEQRDAARRQLLAEGPGAWSGNWNHNRPNVPDAYYGRDGGGTVAATAATARQQNQTTIEDQQRIEQANREERARSNRAIALSGASPYAVAAGQQAAGEVQSGSLPAGAAAAEQARILAAGAESALTSYRAQNLERQQALELEQQIAEAAAKGPAAEKELAAQMAITLAYAKQKATATGEDLAHIEAEEAAAHAQVSESLKVDSAKAINEQKYQEGQQIANTGMLFTAMQTGTDAYEKEKIVLERINELKEKGVEITAQEVAGAEAYASKMVHAKDEMEDFQKAQGELKNAVSGAIDTAQSGIMGMAFPSGRTSIERKIERIDAMRNMGMGFINEGVNTFIKQPAEQLLDNALSGRENTGVGIGSVISGLFGGKKEVDNSSLIGGKSGTGADGAAAGLSKVASAADSAAAALGKISGGSGGGGGGGGGSYGGGGGGGGGGSYGGGMLGGAPKGTTSDPLYVAPSSNPSSNNSDNPLYVTTKSTTNSKTPSYDASGSSTNPAGSYGTGSGGDTVTNSASSSGSAGTVSNSTAPGTNGVGVLPMPNSSGTGAGGILGTGIGVSPGVTMAQHESGGGTFSGTNYTGLAEKVGNMGKGIFDKITSTSGDSSNGGFFGSLIGGNKSILGKWLGIGQNNTAGGTGYGNASVGGSSYAHTSYSNSSNINPGDSALPGVSGGTANGVNLGTGGAGAGGSSSYGAGSGYGAGAGYGGGGFVAGYHGGGLVGSGTPQMLRYVPNAVFATAPRFHSGTKGAGLAPNEVPAVLQRGETVTPAGAAAAGGKSQIVYAPTNVFASDVGSFRASGKQLAAGQQRSLDRAQSSF